MILSSFGRAEASKAASFRHGVSVGHWLAKMDEKLGYGANWFGPNDVAWIAQQGFDHIRLPVDGRLWFRADGTLDETKIAIFERALKWAQDQGLSVILDMHFLPGGKYSPDEQDPVIFTDSAAQEIAAKFWRQVAIHFQSEGGDLRFELINEPYAPENKQLNTLNRALLAAIRSVDSNRIVYITSNQSSVFTTVADIDVPADPKVAIIVHYDEPLVFTHQRASWKHFPADMPLVYFPGRVPDLSQALPSNHFAFGQSGKELTVASIESDFARVQSWAKRAAPGHEIQLGEFGTYEQAPAESRQLYTKAVREAAEHFGWGWTIWDYHSSFAIRAADGTATAPLAGLFSEKPQQ